MALRRVDGKDESMQSESLSGMKAKRVFANSDKEKKILTTFSIEPSFCSSPSSVP